MRVLFSILILTAALSLRAEKMDLSTHDLLVEKLERVVGTLETDDASRLPVTLRLADLYAERARLRSMSEVAQTGQEADLSKQDRKRSLELYKQSFDRITGQ